MNRFTLAALSATLLISTGAQAHQYAQQVTEWSTRLKVAGAEVERAGCYSDGTEAGTSHITCATSDAADLAASLLETIKPDASDKDAERLIGFAVDALHIGTRSESTETMFDKLKGKSDKAGQLASGLDEMVHTAGYMGLAILPEKEAAK